MTEPGSSPLADDVPASRLTRRADRIASLAGAALLAAIYLATAAPCAWWGDGLELSCAAWTLGVAHPTGYPLYTVTGHAWMRSLHALFGMDPGRALTLYSLACLVLAGAVVIRLLTSVIRLAMDDYDRAIAKTVPDWPILSKKLNTFPPAPALGLFLGLFIGISDTLWDHATFAEVYPLTYCLGALVVAFCWRMRDRLPDARHALVLGMLMGLLAIHHYSGSAMGPLALAVTIDWTLRARRAGRRGWPILLVAAGTFLTIFAVGYGTLILLARPNPPLNWGDPSNFTRLMWVMRGGQFGQIRLGFGGGWMLEGLKRWIEWWGSQWNFGFKEPDAPIDHSAQIAFGVAYVVMAFLGIITLTRRHRALGLGLAGALAMTAVFGAIYHIPDIDAYFMVALPSAAMGWIMTFKLVMIFSFKLNRWLAKAKIVTSLVESRRKRSNWAAIASHISYAFFLITIISYLSLSNGFWIYKSGDLEPLAWGARAMDALPKDALVLTAGDNDIYALWHQQMVLGKRPDVTVFGANFIFSGWYRRYFDRPDRPRVPLRVEDRPIAPEKITFDVAVVGDVILPNLRAGRRVFVTYRDPLLEAFFNPKPVQRLLPDGYREWFVQRNLDTLPSPMLYELQPNPDLAKTKASDLEWTFYDWYRRQQATKAND